MISIVDTMQNNGYICSSIEEGTLNISVKHPHFYGKQLLFLVKVREYTLDFDPFVTEYDFAIFLRYPQCRLLGVRMGVSSDGANSALEALVKKALATYEQLPRRGHVGYEK